MRFILFKNKAVLCIATLLISQLSYGSTFYANDYEYKSHGVKSNRFDDKLIQRLEQDDPNFIQNIENIILEDIDATVILRRLKQLLRKNQIFDELAPRIKHDFLKKLAQRYTYQPKGYEPDFFNAINELAETYTTPSKPRGSSINQGQGHVRFEDQEEQELQEDGKFNDDDALNPINRLYNIPGFMNEIKRIIIKWSQREILFQEDLKSPLKSNETFNNLEIEDKIILLKHFSTLSFIEDNDQKNSLIQNALNSIANSYKTIKLQSSDTQTTTSVSQLFQSATSTPSKNLTTNRSSQRNSVAIDKKLSEQQQADILIKSSYISPEMQYAVLSLVGLSWHIDNKTGVVYNIPTIESIKQDAINNLNKADRMTPIFKEKTFEITADALKSALEAVNIAIFIDSVQKAYQDDSYLFYPTSDRGVYLELEAYKIGLTEILKYKELQPAVTSQISSMSSWVSSFVWSSTPSKTESEMDQIILQNNYKNIKYDSSGIKAANLLFKQCFISQKHYLDSASSDLGMIVDLKINNPNDLLDNVPNINEFIKIAYDAAKKTTSRGSISEKAQHLTSIHKHVLNVRQAIQTALYIANANSSYNLSYIPSLSSLLGYVPQPSYLASYLDPIVHTLSQYDKKLSRMSIDKQLGASNNDVFRNQVWTAITYIAGGLAVGAIVGYDYNYGFIKEARDTLSSTYNDFFQAPTKQEEIATVKNVQTAIQPSQSIPVENKEAQHLLEKVGAAVGGAAEISVDSLLTANYNMIKPLSTSLGNKVNDATEKAVDSLLTANYNMIKPLSTSVKNGINDVFGDSVNPPSPKFQPK